MSTGKALKIAMSAIGSSGIEKIEALFKIRELVVNDESIKGTDARNTHPAFKAVLESLSEVGVPTEEDFDANDKGKYKGVLNASNLVGILASLNVHIGALKDKNINEKDILKDPDVKCIILQCRHLSGV